MQYGSSGKFFWHVHDFQNLGALGPKKGKMPQEFEKITIDRLIIFETAIKKKEKNSNNK